MLYGLIHARYILSSAGMHKMVIMLSTLFLLLKRVCPVWKISKCRLRALSAILLSGSTRATRRFIRCYSRVLRRGEPPYLESTYLVTKIARRSSVPAATRPTTRARPSTPTWTELTSAPPSVTCFCSLIRNSSCRSPWRPTYRAYSASE